MKILVVGATGQTGTHLLNKLLAQGHEVTAFVREASKISLKHKHLKTAQGDARNLESLLKAVKGQEAVMSVLGPRTIKKDNLQEEYMKNLVSAMTQSGVKRLINLSAMAAGDSHDGAPFFMRKIILPLFLGKLFEDKNRGELILFASSLDYVNVRPGRLTNGAARGGIKASLDYAGLKPSMARDDLANFMIEQLKSPQWTRKSPLIGY